MALDATGQRLIAEKGREVTLRTKSTTVADADAPWDANGSATTATISAVILDYQDREIDGTLVQRRDRKALVSPLDAASIVEGDEIVDGGQRYAIVSVRPVKPGATNYLWKLQLRG